MKKIVVTRENYEEVMFDLLEDTYSKEVREDILDQINADTFLSFEWKQWSKAMYSEGLERYKREEAEFLESLVRKNGSKGIIIPIYRKMYWAAAVAMVLGIGYMFLRPDSEDRFNMTSANPVINQGKNVTSGDTGGNTEMASNTLNLDNRVKGKSTELQNEIDTTPSPLIRDIARKDEFLNPEIVVQQLESAFRDSIQPLFVKHEIKTPSPKSRFKVSITEGKIDDTPTETVHLVEKRYTMADVIAHKDGITLSKFMDNPKVNKVIRNENSTYIEYIAADMSILVLTLSN